MSTKPSPKAKPAVSPEAARIAALRKRIASNKAKAKKRLAAIENARHDRRLALDAVNADQAEIARLGGKVKR